MIRQLRFSFLALILLMSQIIGSAPVIAGDENKPAIKPPFPDGEPELPLLPPPVKNTPAETAPLPRSNDTNKAFDIIMVAATKP